MTLLARLFGLIAPVSARRVRRCHTLVVESLECRELLAGTTTKPNVSITASDASAAETASGKPVNGGTFLISRTGSSVQALTVTLTISGTAESGIDYVAIPTTVTIPAGAISTTINVAVKDDLVEEDPETVTLTLAAATSYTIGNSTATVNIADNEVVVFNDNFSDRIKLLGTSATAKRTNSLATRETGEPNVAGVGGGKTMWWTWKAPSNGTVTITTAGSTFDTVLGVYTGSSVRSLTQVVVNDDESNSDSIYTSKVTFSAVAGKTYQIVVDGYKGLSGQIQLALKLTPPTITTTTSLVAAPRQAESLFLKEL